MQWLKDLVYGVGTVDFSYKSPDAVSATGHKCLFCNATLRWAQKLLPEILVGPSVTERIGLMHGNIADVGPEAARGD